MPKPRFPAVFVSHGAPTMIQTPSPAQDFMAGLGDVLGRPEAILCISAHWETDAPAVSLAEHPETIHDFYGFPGELYEIQYPAPGAPALARRTAELLEAAGLDCEMSDDRGLDHGAWAPLKLIYGGADIPVTQLSQQHGRGTRHHLDLGRALAPLRDEGVLILASGGATHNLGGFRPGGSEIDEWASRFDDWLAEVVEGGDTDALVDYRDRAPDAATVHPRDEHFLPLLCAFGAGGEGTRGRALHRSFMDGSLSMAAFAFD